MLLTKPITIPIDDNKRLAITAYRSYLYRLMLARRTEIRNKKKEQKKLAAANGTPVLGPDGKPLPVQPGTAAAGAPAPAGGAAPTTATAPAPAGAAPVPAGGAPPPVAGGAAPAPLTATAPAPAAKS